MNTEGANFSLAHIYKTIRRHIPKYSRNHHIIIIVTLHQLDIDRPVSTSSNSLFKVPPSRLRPNGLQFSITFAILLLFIPVTCRSQFDLYLIGLSTGSAFSSSTMS